MNQAKVPDDTEMKRLLPVVEAAKQSARNRVAFRGSDLGGRRVGKRREMAERGA